MIDPAPFWVGGERTALACRIRRGHFAIVAAADDTRTIGRRGKDRASVHGSAPLVALRLDHQQRLIAEHEHGRTAEKMRGDHRRLGGDVARAFGEGDGVVAALRHGALRNGKGWCGNSWAAAQKYFHTHLLNISAMSGKTVRFMSICNPHARL